MLSRIINKSYQNSKYANASHGNIMRTIIFRKINIYRAEHYNLKIKSDFYFASSLFLKKKLCKLFTKYFVYLDHKPNYIRARLQDVFVYKKKAIIVVNSL